MATVVAVANPTLPWATALPDQTTSLITYLSTTLSLLADVRAFVEARSQLEREYGQKLQVLTRKLGERKDRKMAALCVGDEPSKTWESGMEKKNTFITCLESHLALMENTASVHLKLADDLQSQVIDELKRSEKKKEEGKKKIQAYVQQAVEDRDKLYHAREKAKGKYFESCSENDSTRLKLEKAATGDRHEDRYSKAYETSTVDMHNNKNDYILSLHAANETKRRFYGHEMPVIASEIQAMHGSALERLSTLLCHTATLSSASLTNLSTYSGKMSNTWTRLVVPQDQDLYADFNIRVFLPPKDWGWEPCPGYYADETMDLGERGRGGSELVYLQNRLGRGRKDYDRLENVINGQKREIQNNRQLISQYFVNRGLGDPDDVVDTMLSTMKDMASNSIRQEALVAEISTLEAILGDDQGVQQPHDFKPASFTIPVPCDHCQGSIWGTSKNGMTCRACGCNVHTKCELKAAANCSSSSIAPITTERRRPPSVIGSAISGLSRKESNHGRSSSQEGASTVVSPISGVNPLAGIRKSFTSRRISTENGLGHIRTGSGNGVPSEEQIHLPPPHALDSNYMGYYPPIVGSPSTPTSSTLPGSTSPASTLRHGPKRSPTIAEENRFEVPANHSDDPPLVLAMVVFPYTAVDTDEVSVEKDRQVRLISPNDGSGWVKIRLGVEKGCKEGLVPADYISIQRPNGSTGHARLSSTSGTKVRALYDYVAQGEDEIALVEGQIYTLSNVGKSWGEGEDGGWWELLRPAGGGVGVAPANYLQDA